jgi:nucleoside-diphosphate-sugar epimerase
MYNVAGISPSAQELEQAIRKRLPTVQISYTPDPLRTAIVESWPQQIDDSVARHDWNWKPQWNLEQITDKIIEVLGDELARQ